MIDWNDPKAKISKYFTVGEALYLPSWGVYHNPSEEEKQSIIETAKKMDQIRDFIGYAIKVHCWIRPTKVNCQENQYLGQDYNKFVGGATKSAHIEGKAVDWSAIGYPSTSFCDELREKLLPQLQVFDIRMENHSGPWLHIDIRPPVNNNRYFKP